MNKSPLYILDGRTAASALFINDLHYAVLNITYCGHLYRQVALRT